MKCLSFSCWNKFYTDDIRFVSPFASKKQIVTVIQRLIQHSTHSWSLRISWGHLIWTLCFWHLHGRYTGYTVTVEGSMRTWCKATILEIHVLFNSSAFTLLLFSKCIYPKWCAFFLEGRQHHGVSRTRGPGLCWGAQHWRHSAESGIWTGNILNISWPACSCVNNKHISNK